MCDVLRSAVLRNRTWLTSTFRFEARSRYKAAGPVFEKLPEFREFTRSRETFKSRAQRTSVRVPWDNGATSDFSRWLLPPSNDSFAIAPRRLFAMMPYSANNAVTHLTKARGFQAKVRYLKSIGKWFVEEQAEQAALAARDAAREAARDQKLMPGRHPSTGRDRRLKPANQTAGHKYFGNGSKSRPRSKRAGKPQSLSAEGTGSWSSFMKWLGW
jgi:hypothetical protein